MAASPPGATDGDGADRQGAIASVLRTFEAGLTIVGGVIVFAMMALSVSDALLRSVLNTPVFGANDFTQVLLAAAVAVSLPLCVMAGRAIAIDTLVALLPSGIRRPLNWLVSIGGSAMLLYLAWRCVLNGHDAAAFGETTMLLRIPYGPFYYGLAAGLGISALLMVLARTRR
ncbi:MAG: TRAP transporter small permease [Inquilinaceae bacterium]